MALFAIDNSENSVTLHYLDVLKKKINFDFNLLVLHANVSVNLLTSDSLSRNTFTNMYIFTSL